MRIVFMGTPDSAVPSLRRLIEDGHEILAVWTQPDRPAGRGKHLHESPIKQFAVEHRLTVHQPIKIKTSEAKDLFASHNADLAVVVAYGKILPNEFLSAPKEGCLNVHFSLLPKYRGAAPVNWALVNGETETGVTTMRIAEELDSGPILLQERTSIGTEETAPQLMVRLADSGAELLSATLKRLNEIQATPQNNVEVTFAPMLKRKDGLIDWSMDAFAIERRVRGFQPWPNAFTTLNSRRLIVWHGAPAQNLNATLAPGQIIESQGDSLLVACGDQTTLQILELQPEHSRRMSARDFVNGSHVKVGEVLGS